MQLIVWLLVGALAGWIASIIMKTDAQMGALANIAVGILGSILGGFLYTLLFKGNADFTTAFLNFHLGSLIISIVGAVVLLALLKFFRKDKML